MNYKFIVINTSGGGDWVIDDNVDNGGVYIRSKNKHLINLPQNGWEYISNNEWYDDTTMQVKGNYISFSMIEKCQNLTTPKNPKSQSLEGSIS